MPTPPPDNTQQHFPTPTQTLVLFFAGLVLALGGCAGYLQGALEVTHPNAITYVFGAIFFLGASAILLSLVSFVAIIVRRAMRG